LSGGGGREEREIVRGEGDRSGEVGEGNGLVTRRRIGDREEGLDGIGSRSFEDETGLTKDGGIGGKTDIA
jgi:hypothetical protein